MSFYLNDSSDCCHVLDAILARIEAKIDDYPNPVQKENVKTYANKLKDDPSAHIRRLFQLHKG